MGSDRGRHALVCIRFYLTLFYSLTIFNESLLEGIGGIFSGVLITEKFDNVVSTIKYLGTIQSEEFGGQSACN